MGRRWVRAALRWAITTVGVGLLVLLMLHLSSWQWNKHVVRNTQISRQEHNLALPVAPLGRVLTATVVPATQEWRRVRLVGVYDAAHQVVVTLRTVGGVPGSEVLTPLRSPGSTAVLVDRGFYPIPDDAAPGSPGAAPAPPAGTVTVTGYLRVSETGSKAPSADGRELTITAIQPAVLSRGLGYPLLDGYVSMVASATSNAGGLQQIVPPTYDTGPYLSYSVQWVIFCVIAVGGLLMLAVDEFGGGRLRARLREPAPRPVGAAGPGGPAGRGGGAGRAPADGLPVRPGASTLAADTPVGVVQTLRPPAPVPSPSAARTAAPVETAASSKRTRTAPAAAVTVLAGPSAGGGALPADFYDDPDDTP